MWNKGCVLICWLLGEFAPVSLIHMHFHKFHIHMFLTCMWSFFLNKMIYDDAELCMSNNSISFPCCCKAEKEITDFMLSVYTFIVCGSCCLHIIYQQGADNQTEFAMWTWVDRSSEIYQEWNAWNQSLCQHSSLFKSTITFLMGVPLST